MIFIFDKPVIAPRIEVDFHGGQLCLSLPRLSAELHEDIVFRFKGINFRAVYLPISISPF